MKIKSLVLLIVFAANAVFMSYKLSAQTPYQKDFQEFWTDINQHYAYLDQQKIDWSKVKEIYTPLVNQVSDKAGYIRLMEGVLNELHNGHVSLSTNLPGSNRLVPSGLDLRVEQLGNKYLITDLRKGFGADLCGLKIGMEVTAFNDKPIDKQLKQFLPSYTAQWDSNMYQYALDMLFAGTHDTLRAITVKDSGRLKTFHPLNYGNSPELLFSKKINKNTGYIRINNSLGNNDLIAAFDSALDSLLLLKSLVIDLTETPGGGNSTVARAIMGRFITTSLPYQVHEFDEKAYQTKRHWVEYVTPRKKVFSGKVYVLVSRWTGSMGEGIAIGFDGMKRADIIGTPMAGLLGAVSGFRMTETGIGFQLPTERLYHVNGTPRENFVPGTLTRNMEETILKAKQVR
ncbi:S41 family peptidase [Niabella sp. CJ426]|uniref:S41 family peptidase n=1 Tax=Niabella sp. CJ426 TaxID=3393740 RepID=UPI003CFC84DD